MALLFERELKKLDPPPLIVDKHTMKWGRLTLLYCELDDGTLFMHLSVGDNCYVDRYHPDCIPECITRVRNWIRWFT